MIKIRGARQNNLKSVDVDIPLNKLVLITGVSGSGKSSLAIDTLFAESNRRYFENFSAGTSSTVSHLPRPDVDTVSNILPSVGLLQNLGKKSPRETLASFCEVYNYLKLLFAREGSYWCRESGQKLEALAPNQVVPKIMELKEGTKVEIHAPLSLVNISLDEVLARGFSRVVIDGEVYLLDEAFPEVSKANQENISVVIDRVKLKSNSKQRLLEAVESAYALSDSSVEVFLSDENKALSFSEKIHSSGLVFLPLAPEILSFNSIKGACPTCSGLGTVDGKVCKDCGGTRLGPQARSVKLNDVFFSDLISKTVGEVLEILNAWLSEGTWQNSTIPLIEQSIERLSSLDKLSLSYLSLISSIDKLSTGEFQRLRLARQLSGDFSGVLYVLDEPSRGLDPKTLEVLISGLRELIEKGNSVLVVDHKRSLIEAADHIIDIGPEAGRQGGEVVFDGDTEGFKVSETLTAQFLSGKSKIFKGNNNPAGSSINFSNISLESFKFDDFKLPLNQLVAITGRSGSGKTLLARNVIYPFLNGKVLPNAVLSGADEVKKVRFINSHSLGDNPRSTVVTAVGAFDSLRSLYAQLPEAKKRGWNESRFSYNNKEGRCPVCEGRGEIKINMDFLLPVYKLCESCRGSRFAAEISDVKFKGYSLVDVMNMSVKEAAKVFSAIKHLNEKLNLLEDVGLSYLKLGQATRTLSGGEKQRIDLIRELNRTISGGSLIIIDEASAGLHMSDLDVLLRIFSRLVEQGNSVVLLDHDPDVLEAADHVIKLDIDRIKNYVKLIQ